MKCLKERPHGQLSLKNNYLKICLPQSQSLIYLTKNLKALSKDVLNQKDKKEQNFKIL